jgi:hypothetical protein
MIHCTRGGVGNEAFLLKSEMRHEFHFFSLLFKLLFEFTTRAIREEKEIKGIYLEKESI